MPARKLRRSAIYPTAFDHGFDAEMAFLVEGDIAHAKRLGLGDVGRAGIAAVLRDLPRRLAVRRNVALQHGQKALAATGRPRSWGRFAVAASDDCRRQA